METAVYRYSHKLPSSNRVSMFWIDKISLFILFLQVHGLLWILTFNLEWPYLWMNYMCFTLLFVLDIPAFTEYNGLSYQPLVHCIVIVAIPLIVMVMYYRLQKNVAVYGDMYYMKLDHAKMIMFYGGEFMYICVLIAMFKLSICDSDGNKMFLSDSVSCYGAAHSFIMLLVLLCFIFYIVLWPYYVYKHCTSLLAYNTELLHERYLQAREMEQLLEITSHYEHNHMYTICSYTRKFSKYKAFEYPVKCWLVGCIFLLGPYHIGSNQALAQTIAFAIPFYVNFTVGVLFNIYRTSSTYHAYACLYTTMCVNTFFSIFSAAQVRSALLVASTLTSILVSLNAIGGGCFFLVTLLHLFRPRAELFSWPVSLTRLKIWFYNDEELIETLHRAKYYLIQSTVVALPLMPTGDLAAIVYSLQKHRESCKAVGHVLEWTVQDMLEDMTRLFLDTAPQSLLPNDFLEESLKGMRTAMTKKAEEHVTMQHVKRKVLLKLLVANAFLNKNGPEESGEYVSNEIEEDEFQME